jgi:hypothetical protein
MSSLKDFLNDKTLPVKIRIDFWSNYKWFEVRYFDGKRYYGHHSDSLSGSYHEDEVFNWCLFYQEPRTPIKACAFVDKKGNVEYVLDGSTMALNLSLSDDWRREPALDREGK